MRLQPIETPRGLMMKLYYAAARKMFGKVIAPAKALYARVPALAVFSATAYYVEERGVTLSPALKLLLKEYVAFLNGCSFCLDMAQSLAVQRRLSLDKFYEVSNFRQSPLFSASERAALEYAYEATTRKTVSEAVFEELRARYSDTEIVGITFVCALENYYNLMSLPLELESDGLCAIALGESHP